MRASFRSCSRIRKFPLFNCCCVPLPQRARSAPAERVTQSTIMRTTAPVSRTHARDGVSRDHHRMCSRHLRLRRNSTGEGAARAQRDAELEADQEVHVAELVLLLVLLLLDLLLLLPPSLRRRHVCACVPPLPPASRAPPLARRPGPELELRFSRRRGGAQRSNCSQRHSYRLGDGAAAAAPPRPSSPASPASHIGGQGPGPSSSSSSASATGAAARREATAATGKQA